MLRTFQEYSALLRWEYLWKFFSVGAIGAVIDNFVLVGLVELVHVDPLFGKIVSAECSIITMFVINETWTFSEYGERTFLKLGWRLVMSNVIRFGGLLVGIVTMYVLYKFLGVWYLLSNIFGIGLGFVVNYAFESIITWDVLGETAK